MKAHRLRKKAEEELKKLPHLLDSLSENEAKSLLHELSVHRIELEMQNEELRGMQERLSEVSDQYTDLFDYAPVGYFIVDAKGIIQNANLTGCRILNYERNSLKGKPFSVNIANSEGSRVFFKYLKEVFNSGPTQSCEILLKRKGGETFAAILASSIKADVVENKVSCRMTLRDLTQEKKTIELIALNKALQKEKEKAHQYLELSGVFFMALDRDGRITMINKTGCSILGYSCNLESGQCISHSIEGCQIEGKNWFENYIPENQREEAKKEFQMLLRKKTPINVRNQSFILTRNRNVRFISWKNNVIEDDEGKIVGVLSSGEDITEQKLAENALKESERMFRTLFETAAESIIMTDHKGEIVAVNNFTVELFGYKKEELQGKLIGMLIPERFRVNHINRLKDYAKNSQSKAMVKNKELYAQKKSGKEFPIEVSLSSYSNGDELLMMALISDVTIRKAAKEKLENLNIELEHRVTERTRALNKSQHLYKTIARNFPNGVINVLDKNLNYVFVEGMEMYKKGIVGKMLIGTNYINRLDAEIKDDIEKKLKRVLKGKNMSFEKKSKKSIHMINAVGLIDSNNEINQILVVSQNITRLKKAEEDTLRLLEKEQQLNELKTRFVSMASHEFRTPLTTTLNSINLIEKYIDKPDSDEKQKSHINRIRSSVHNLSGILNDFLSLDKLEEGKIDVHTNEFDLSKFSTEVAEIFRGIAKKGQRITYTHSGIKTVITDRQVLRNILNNLLSNAVKYSQEGSKIKFNTKVENDMLVIVVEDNGIGIPLEEQKHLFERFFRAKNTINIQGTGLGLNIIKNYLDLVNGQIHFESTLDKGTTFTVQIPV